MAACPPGKVVAFDFARIDKDHTDASNIIYTMGDALLYCPNESCKRELNFLPTGRVGSLGNRFKAQRRHPTFNFLEYVCRNCSRFQKTFALLTFSTVEKPNFPTEAMKIGEYPGFGPPVRSNIYKLVGRDRDMFLVGWSAERQGMGIGAFAYYRRVIENQKVAILTEIQKAVQTLQPTSSLIGELEAAKGETQFTRAIDSIKHTLPDALFIEGQNPLTMIHTALSKGIHELPDDECLLLAKAVRTLLVELSDRITQIRKDNSEVRSALSALMATNAKKGEGV